MSYIKTVASSFGGKPEQKIDLLAFTTDLARELGGTVEPRGDSPDVYMAVKVGKDCLTVYSNNWKKRIDVSISAPDVRHDDRKTYDAAHKTQSASINPDGRAIARIAADIKRRVIDASQEALRLQREHAAHLQAMRRTLASVSDAMRKATGLRVRPHDTELKAHIDSAGTGCAYIDATLYADDTVSVHHLNSVSAETFRAIVQLLNRDRKAQE